MRLFNIVLIKPHRDHNANIPLYTPTFGESINSVTQLQMHEALQSIDVHNLLKIMLNNLLGWHHTMSLPKPTSSIGRYWGYRFPCGILVSCLNDKFAFILSENSVVPFFFSLDPARSDHPDSSRPLSRACQLPRTLQVQQEAGREPEAEGENLREPECVCVYSGFLGHGLRPGMRK